ncbi:MAG: hypothetical protein KGJ93_02395 [Patescibacteria group bacterium]|nr:hypothetical protein [Patescibacteria group bacterium]
MFSNLLTYLWLSLAVLALGSIYLIIEGYRVHKLFAGSVVGQLVKALVVILLIEIYSLGIVCFAFAVFYPKGVWVVFPIILLWIVCVGFAIAAVRLAKQQVSKLIR